MAEAVICPERLKQVLEDEEAYWRAANPTSIKLFAQAQKSLLRGVPMLWMVRTASKVPVFVGSARGAHLTDVDGHELLDLAMGDTGAQAGHAPPPVVAAVSAQARKGFTFMLPTEDAAWVGDELARRFALPVWAFALTATDANRTVIRLARHVTKRPKIVVFNMCYHGSVDEVFITLAPDGTPTARAGNIGPPVDPSLTTKVVEFNDAPALERALAPGDVAAVLMEPVMTNIGIIHPEPGFLDAVRRLTRLHGALLIIDETHTISAGPGGVTQAEGLSPDAVVIGKPIAGGVPMAAYGLSRDLATRVAQSIDDDESDTGGIGGTLAGNALSLAAARATLQHVLTDAAFERMLELGERLERGVAAAIARRRLPWVVKRLGCRVEYWFRPTAPRNGGEAAAACDPDLDRFMHLAALNRGVWLTPFHSMMLLCPDSTGEDVARAVRVFEESVEVLLGLRPPLRASDAPEGASRSRL